MIQNILTHKKQFNQRQQILDNARAVLKTEFVGIDTIIDDIIDNVSYWYNFHQIQERPLIINLWGLTGVGKTSLINRLVELIDFSTTYYRFDMGKKNGRFSFGNALEELCDNDEKVPLIIALDEIQHARTIVGLERFEKNDENSRMMWELIDSGKVQYFKWTRQIWSFYEHINILSKLLIKGVVVKNGYVVKGTKLFVSETDLKRYKKENIPFLEEVWFEYIISEAGKELGLVLKIDLENIIYKMDGPDIIAFLNKVMRILKRPGIKSFKSALIFILGNLDEVYTMGSNFTVEIEADEFYKESKRIDVTKVKLALRKRFRDEQIARMGNIHIIYPALSRNAYEQIIAMELAKLISKMQSYTGLDFVMDQSVHRLIYNEGVYPVQGARPVFTTINQMIGGNMTFFISQVITMNQRVDKLVFHIQGHQLVCDFYKDNLVVSTKQRKLDLSLENIRSSANKEVHAIVAVHESGHAILSTILMNEMPESIHSVTTDSTKSGFVYSRNKREYLSRSLIVPKVAVILGGYLAEEIIFGKEHLTTGSESDVLRATDLLFELFMQNGMGDLPISYGIPIGGMHHRYHKYADVEEQIRLTLEEAKALAENTLRKEIKLLSYMAEYLSNNNEMKKTTFKSFWDKYAISKQDNTLNKIWNYRNRIQELVKQQSVTNYSEGSLVVLNKDNN